jgi:hypothetical protein
LTGLGVCLTGAFFYTGLAAGFLTAFLAKAGLGSSVAAAGPAYFSAFAAADAYLLSSSKLTFSRLALAFALSYSTSVFTTSAAYAKPSGGFSSGVTPIWVAAA